MSSFFVVILVLVTLTSLFCIGLVSLSQNIWLMVRVYFSLAILFLNGWMLLLYLSNINSPVLLFANRAVYASPMLGMLLLGQFADVYYRGLRPFRVSLLGFISLLVGVPSIVVALSAANVTGVTPRLYRGVVTGYSIIPGHLSILVALSTILLAATLVIRLVSAYSSATKNAKQPLRIIILTLFIAIATAMITNILFPLIFGGSDAANAASSIAAALFIISLAYSVLRYSFLDVRILVVRSVGFVAGMGVILGLAAVVQTLIFDLLGEGDFHIRPVQRFALTGLFVVAALSFRPLSILFARITGRIFFKGGYDSAAFISAF